MSTPRRHVRILAGRLDRGAGSHVYHVELATRLVARGHRVSVVCFDTAGAPPGGGYETAVVPRRAGAPLPLAWRFAAVGDWWACRRGLWQAALDRPDVVVGGEHLFLEPHARRFPSVPWLYLPHSLLLEHEFAGYGLDALSTRASLFVYGRIQRWALQASDRTVRFTRYGADALERRWGGRTGARYVVNPAGVDLPPPVTRTRGPLLRLLSINTLVRRKNVDLALMTLAALRDLPWEYEVVGGGEERPRLERLTDDLGLAGRVRFHGHRANPEAFYRRADLFLLPSRSESFGIALVEAMSHGLPVVAMRADGREYFNPFGEIVTDGHDGLLADGARGLAACLERALRAPEHLSAMGERARETVRTRFSWDAHLDRYESVFAELEHERRAGGPHSRMMAGTTPRHA